MASWQMTSWQNDLAPVFKMCAMFQVGLDATPKEIKKKYREMSLIYHPDKPTGNEKLFMKLTKAYDALTDETARSARFQIISETDTEFLARINLNGTC